MQRNLFFENPAAKSLSLVILLLLTALSHGFIQTNIEPQSMIEDTRMEAHNNTSSSPYLNLGLSMATYYVGDTVSAYMDSYNLVVNETYVVDWSLNNGTQSGSFNWTAYNTSSYEDVNITGLPAGYHCIDVELFENGTSVDADSICFTIMSTTSTYPSGIEVSMYNTQITYGNTAWINLWAHNLTVNENHTMHWVLNGSTFQSGNISFYANYSDHYDYLSFQNLSVGYYCFSAELFINNATGTHYLDWDSVCFNVVNQSTMYPPSIYMWSNWAMYYLGDTVGIGIDAMNLDYNESYEIDWTLNNGTQTGNYMWTAYSTYNSEFLNLSGLPVGYHCVDAELFENGTSVDTDTICFQILSASAQIPEVSAYVHNTPITYGNTAHAEFYSNNLTTNESYTFLWSLNGTSSQSGNITFQVNGSFYWDSISFQNLSIGYYCLGVDLFHYNATGTHWLDSDYTCFDVVNQSTTYPPSIYMWSNWATYYLGDTVGIGVDAMNLDYNESYEIDWTLNNGTQSGNYVWTAYNTYNSEYLNLTGLPVGYHCVDAELFENGTSVDTDTICFQILSAATPMVNLYMYNTQITYGNTAFVDFAASNITNNETYTFHWNLNGTSFQSGNITFQANSSYHWDSISFQNLSIGFYCISVDLFHNNATGPHWLDWDYTCFDVVNQSTTYPPAVWIGTDMVQYQVGDLVEVEIESYDLVVNDYYFLEWDLNNGSQVGNFSWYAYSTLSLEIFNLSGLPIGSHCISATLYDNTSSSAIDFDYTCFYITAASGASEEITIMIAYDTYEEGDTVTAYLSAYNLSSNMSYSIEWNLWNDGVSNLVESGYINWTANMSSFYDSLEFMSLVVEGYDLEVILHKVDAQGNQTWLDTEWVWFDVEEAPGDCGNQDDMVYLEVESYEFWMDIETPSVYLDTYCPLWGSTYKIEWVLEDSAGLTVEDGSKTWIVEAVNVTYFPGNPHQFSEYDVHFENLVHGSYYIEGILSTYNELNNTWAYVDSDSWEFMVEPFVDFSIMGADGIYYEGETANIYTDFWPNFSPNNTSFEFIWELEFYDENDQWMPLLSMNGTHAWIMNTWGSEHHSFTVANLPVGEHCLSYSLRVDAIEEYTGEHCMTVISMPDTNSSIMFWHNGGFILNDMHHYNSTADVDIVIEFIHASENTTGEIYIDSYNPYNNTWHTIFVDQHQGTFTHYINASMFAEGCWNIDAYISDDSSTQTIASHLGETFTIGDSQSCVPIDSDGDGTPDGLDAFPTNPTQWSDTDGDGYGDNASGVNGDAFPDDPNEWMDADGDGIGDNADTCVGILDALGVCEGNCLSDNDNDGICDVVDDCIGVYDSCGVCNGPGAIYECGCSDIAEGNSTCPDDNGNNTGNQTVEPAEPCPEDEFVIGNACIPCPVGTTNEAGDDPAGLDTMCDIDEEDDTQGNGTEDDSVSSEGLGGLPGFPATLAFMAMMGAAIMIGRKKIE